jgi:hypothetical protein
MELGLQNSIDSLSFLLFPKLEAVLGNLFPTLAVLSGGIGSAVYSTLSGITTITL